MIKIYSFLILLLLTTACSKDSNIEKVDSNTLDLEHDICGRWKLLYVTGGITGVSYNFENEDVTWTINSTTQMVTVVNNNSNDNMIDIAETGNYNYRINTDPNPLGCGETFVLDIMDLGCVYIQNGHLIMDQTFADGMRVEFER
jgi:hypothetical protein